MDPTENQILHSIAGVSEQKVLLDEEEMFLCEKVSTEILQPSYETYPSAKEVL